MQAHRGGAQSFYPLRKKRTPLKESSLVRETGLEPVRDYHTPLKRARLPIPPLSHILFARNVAYYSKDNRPCQAFFSKNFILFFNILTTKKATADCSAVDGLSVIRFCFHRLNYRLFPCRMHRRFRNSGGISWHRECPQRRLSETE